MKMQVNVCVIQGNLVSNPELKILENTTLCNLTIANNSGYGKYQKTSYIDVTVFGKQAESCNQYLEKGSPVIVTGRWQQDRWKSKGKLRSKDKLIANQVVFLPRNKTQTNEVTEDEFFSDNDEFDNLEKEFDKW